MSNAFLTSLLVLTSIQALGQGTLSGTVSDANTHTPVTQANVSLVGGQATHDDTTDAKGNFILHLVSTVQRGDIVWLRVQKTGYDVYNEKVPVAAELPRPIQLVPSKPSRSNSGQSPNAESTASKKPPNEISDSTSSSDTIAVEVRRKVPVVEFSFTTSGEKRQRVPLSVLPQVLQIEPKPTLVKDEDLPKDVPVAGGTITVLRFGEGHMLLDTRDVPKGTTIRGQILAYVNVQKGSGEDNSTGVGAIAQGAGGSVQVGGSGNVSAPFGIAVAPGATAVHPTVINNGAPPLPTPNVKVCVSYPDVPAGQDRVAAVTFATDVQMVRPWFALFFDGPVLDGSATMPSAGFFGYGHMRADRMANPERSFVFRLDSINMGTNTWHPRDGVIKIVVPSKDRVQLIKVLAGAGDNPDVPFNENLTFKCD
jgi:hypothetical protein